MKKIRYYLFLYRTDRTAFRFQLWMVYNRYKITTIKWWFNFLSTLQKNFITIHARPLQASTVATWSDPLNHQPKIAIVLQGRLVTEKNFTLETVLLYKKHFAETFIIVSTDKCSTEDETRLCDQLTAAGATVIQSEKPSITGIGNINLQISSTLAGLKEAQAAGAEFVYKTRCDQRMYAVNINEFLLNLIEAFPVAADYKQKYRIIASSFLTLKYSPYLITDMFQFGYIDDMITYWNATYDTRISLPKPLRTVQDVMDARVSESYLCSEFLQKIGRTPLWTIEDSWRVYADHFCIVDRETLDLFWYKYDFYHEYLLRSYQSITNSQLLTFAEWFNLYRGLSNKGYIPTEGLNLSRQDSLPRPTTL